MDTLGLAKSSKILSIANSLSSRTHFTSEECKSLLVIFEHLAPAGRMNRIGLREFLMGSLDLTDDVMLDLLYRAFDTDLKQGIDETQFIIGLSSMLRGSPDQQINFCYNCFDVIGDGAVVHEEIRHCLRGCIVPGHGIEAEEIEEAEKDVVDMLMRKLDVNGDGVVSIEDFEHAVAIEPLMLQGVGPCLPDQNAMSAFLATFTENYESYSSIFDYSTLIHKYAKLSRVMTSLEVAEILQHKLSKTLRHRRSSMHKYLGPRRNSSSSSAK